MINKAILVGRLTKEPELKSTGGGTSVLNFTVAITRKYKDANGERQSDFINCVAFRGTAEFITQYFKKGDLISIDGTIQTRTWDDTEGKRHYVTEVIAEGVGFVEGKKEDMAVSEALPGLPAEFGTEDVTDGDLPF
jgi:single-strand DNA-binding protein